MNRGTRTLLLTAAASIALVGAGSPALATPNDSPDAKSCHGSRMAVRAQLDENGDGHGDGFGNLWKADYMGQGDYAKLLFLSCGDQLPGGEYRQPDSRPTN